MLEGRPTLEAQAPLRTRLTKQPVIEQPLLFGYEEA